MGEYIFKMPDIGEGVVEAEITEWYIKPGQMVEEDDPIADAMTDKATVELTAPVSGKVIRIGCADGEILAIGAELAAFETEGAGNVSAAPAPSPKKTVDTPAKPEKKTKQAKSGAKKKQAAAEAKANPLKAAAPSGQIGRPLASPAVRRRALDADIDLSRVRATGMAGQITHDDLDQFLQTGGSGAQKARRTGTKEIKLKGMRRVIAERMATAKREIPHFSYADAIDMTAIESLRAHLNDGRSEAQPKLTLLPFFILALVKAAARWPQCNANFDGSAGVLTTFDGVHVGIAAQTDKGLMVPVLHHAEAMDVWQIAAECARLARAAKDGSVKAEELSGGSITLTSLGALGGVVTTPVILHPQTAIIGPNKITEVPVIINGQMQIRKMMNLSSSFDHRVVDGYDAAQMIQYIKGLLEQPATLFIDAQ